MPGPPQPASRPLRVLHLTSTTALGGAEQMVLALCTHRDRDRFDMSVASLSGPVGLVRACEQANPPIRAWKWNVGRPRPWNLPSILRWIALMRAEQFDIVQTYGLQANLIGRLFKRRFGPIRLVCGIRSIDLGRPCSQVWLDRCTAGAADLFISNSEAGRTIRVRRERIDRNRIVTIHNGVALDVPGLADRGRARRELGIAPERFPVIAHVANLRSMKGHGDVLAALPRVLERHRDALVLFAGRDDSGGRYQQESRRLGLGESVRFLGFHPHPRELMRAADVVILPSHYEGCPVTILEAMAETRPILTADVGGIPELVRHEREALLVPPGRPDRLADELIRLCDNTDLRDALATTARERLEKEFTLERMVERYQFVYVDLVRNA